MLANKFKLQIIIVFARIQYIMIVGTNLPMYVVVVYSSVYITKVILVRAVVFDIALITYHIHYIA